MYCSISVDAFEYRDLITEFLLLWIMALFISQTKFKPLSRDKELTFCNLGRMADFCELVSVSGNSFFKNRPEGVTETTDGGLSS